MKRESEGKGQEEECGGMAEEEHEAKWEGVREEIWGNGLFKSQVGKSMLWDAQQKALGDGAVRGDHIPSSRSGTGPGVDRREMHHRSLCGSDQCGHGEVPHNDQGSISWTISPVHLCAQPSSSPSCALQACDCPSQPLGEGLAV